MLAPGVLEASDTDCAEVKAPGSGVKVGAAAGGLVPAVPETSTASTTALRVRMARGLDMIAMVTSGSYFQIAWRRVEASPSAFAARTRNATLSQCRHACRRIARNAFDDHGGFVMHQSKCSRQSRKSRPSARSYQ